MKIDKVSSKKNHLIIYKNGINCFKYAHLKKNFIYLQVLEFGFISWNSLEACRRVLIRNIKGIGNLKHCVKASFWLTSKPKETRMGKGKGSNNFLVLPVKEGSFLFEVEGVSKSILENLFEKAGAKLPVKTRLLTL